MSGTLNKVTLIGSLGKDPEIRSFQNGGQVANFSIATSESWKDKATGEKKDHVEWHRVAVFNAHLIKICESYLRKGSKIYLEGQIETRKYEKDGRDVYTTEIVLRPFNGMITILSGPKEKEYEETHKGFDRQGDIPSRDPSDPAPIKNEIDDEIPF